MKLGRFIQSPFITTHRRKSFLAWGALALVFFSLFVGSEIRNFYPNEERIVPHTAFAKNPTADQDLLGASTQTTNRRRNRSIEVDSNHPRSVAQLKAAMNHAMQEQEAARCRILANFSDENSNFTLVAVEPPSSEQISDARKMISAMAKECDKNHLQEFECAVTELIKESDPFGTLGKKAFFVTISKDDNSPHCSAFLFSVDDFDGLAEKLDPKNKVPYSMKNARWYQNPKGGVLQRLSGIMRQ